MEVLKAVKESARKVQGGRRGCGAGWLYLALDFHVPIDRVHVVDFNLRLCILWPTTYIYIKKRRRKKERKKERIKYLYIYIYICKYTV